MISKRFLMNAERVIRADWWDEGETVTIRKLSWSDVQTIFGKSAEVQNSGSQAQVSFRIDSYNKEILKRGIKAWTFLGENGVPVPITDDFLNLLSAEDGNFIQKEISEFNPEMGRSVEQGNFREESSSK